MKKVIGLVLTAVMAVSLAACGGSGSSAAPASSTAETEAESVAESAAESAAETAGEAAEESAQAPEGEASGLKVALLLTGAANDQGWNQSAYEGALKACEKYGCEFAYEENIDAADIAASFADYAGNGYDVVIGHSFSFGDPALEVAQTYPDTKFIITEGGVSAENVASYVMACEQTGYVEGIIAANMSQTGVIGAIGPIPGDSLVKIVNAYEDGAKSVNPDITVQKAWTNSYVDTQLAQEAAKAMIENNADVIKHCANACGNGAMAAAVEAGIWCQGDSYDQTSLAPDKILDSALYNVDVVIDVALGSVIDGTFKGDVYNLGMADGAVEVLMSDNLPDDVKAIAQDAIDKISSGELTVERDYTLRD